MRILTKPLGRYDADPPTVPPVDFAFVPRALEAHRRSEGFLHRDLRALGARRDIVETLRAAARWEAEGAHEKARAAADLAVTGHREGLAFDALEAARGLEDLLRASGEPREGFQRGVDVVLVRARAVRAWMKASPARRKTAWRAVCRTTDEARPWIGALDDVPHPVNSARTRREERRMKVLVRSPHLRGGKLVVDARVALSARIADRARPVVLLLHGLGSSLEETEGLAEALSRSGIESIAVDLPNHGRTSRIAFRTSDADAPGSLTVNMRETGPSSRGPFYAFEIMTAFVRAAGDAAMRAFPEHAIDRRLCAVAGGSLGGALSLWTGLRPPRWARAVIAWSPATVWASFWEDRHRSKQIALRPRLIEWFGGRVPLTRVAEPEDDEGSRRGEFLRDALFARIPGTLTRVSTGWWRGGDFEAAREVHVRAAHAARRESYDAWHRRWCAALSHDQIAASLRGPDDGSGEAPFGAWPWDRIRVPVLLVAGACDDMRSTRIASACRELAERAQANGAPKGRAMIFESTGHAIHDERPKMLATNIAAFLREALAKPGVNRQATR